MMPSSSAEVPEKGVGGDYLIDAVDVGSWEVAFKMLAQRETCVQARKPGCMV
jgi:hypothetical protein